MGAVDFMLQEGFQEPCRGGNTGHFFGRYPSTATDVDNPIQHICSPQQRQVSKIDLMGCSILIDYGLWVAE